MTMINNLPDYADNYKFIVARICDGEFWVWGAWNDWDKADKAAKEINGVVIFR